MGDGHPVFCLFVDQAVAEVDNQEKKTRHANVQHPPVRTKKLSQQAIYNGAK